MLNLATRTRPQQYKQWRKLRESQNEPRGQSNVKIDIIKMAKFEFMGGFLLLTAFLLYVSCTAGEKMEDFEGKAARTLD